MSFNYSSTLADLYSIDPKNITYIHGVVDGSFQDIVLGHVIEPTSFKDTKRIIEENHRFFSSLRNIKTVSIIGHSISAVDQPYFTEVAASLPSDAEWHVYYLNDEWKNVLQNNLENIGINNKLIRMVKMP